MPVLRLTMDGLVQHQLALGREYIAAARRGTLSGAMRSLALLQQRTRSALPANPGGKGSGGAVNTGFLVRAWKADPTDDGALLHNQAPYSGYVETGRAPGKAPPIEPIVRWAQRRLRLKEEDARGIARRIAWAIGRRGLRGRYIMRDTMPEILAVMREEVMRELEAATLRPGGGSP